jgi:hypothetical protein
VGPIGQSGEGNVLKMQIGVHHCVGLVEANAYVKHSIWTLNVGDMASGSSTPQVDQSNWFIGALISI